MTRTHLRTICLAAATLGLAACNAGPLLTTGSLTASPVAAPPPAGPVDRALHVAATSARATKCGFHFDPAALRTNFLAAEATRGAAPDVLAKTGQSYDYTARTVAAAIPESEVYCSPDRTQSVKAALQAALAGNYEPPIVKPEATSGGLADLFEGSDTPDTFNRDSIYDPLLNEPGKKKADDD